MLVASCYSKLDTLAVWGSVESETKRHGVMNCRTRVVQNLCGVWETLEMI